MQTTTTTDSSFSTTSSLSKDYSSEFKKQAFKSLNFAQNRSIFVSDSLLTNSQSSVSITDRNVNKYRPVIYDNPSTTVKDTITKPIQIQANHKHLKALQHREREPVVSGSVPITSKLVPSSSPPVSANTGNLNRILFRKRFRSKSLDQLPNTTKSNTTKKDKKQAFKGITKERYFYDPRFNKTQTTKKQPKDYKSSSFATSSSFSSDSSTYSHASIDNNFFSRFQWPHKFLSNKLKYVRLLDFSVKSYTHMAGTLARCLRTRKKSEYMFSINFNWVKRNRTFFFYNNDNNNMRITFIIFPTRLVTWFEIICMVLKAVLLLIAY